MNDCVFCKIVKGELPSYNFYEDENYVGFLTINPMSKGHGLVVPKEHMRWVWDSKNIGQYFEVTQKIVLAMKKAFGTDFIIGSAVGNEIHHAHVQLIPRYPDDGHGDSLDLKIEKHFSPEEMKSFAQKIKDNL